MKKNLRELVLVGSLAAGGGVVGHEVLAQTPLPPRMPEIQKTHATEKTNAQKTEVAMDSLDSLGKQEDQPKKKDPKLTGFVSTEVVNKYNGNIVGTGFEDTPAGRVVAGVNVKTKAGTISGSVWASEGFSDNVGPNFNKELDLTAGYTTPDGKTGLDVSRYFVKGGDIVALHVGREIGSFKALGEKFGLRADFWKFLGVSKESPEGGHVGKVTLRHDMKLPYQWELVNLVSAGLDDNPFGLGPKGNSATMAHHTIRAIKHIGGNTDLYVEHDAAAKMSGNTVRGKNLGNFSFGLTKYF